MKISLAGWSATGLRCPDIDIDLSGNTGAPAKVVLIQMPNGTGKTTTLKLLRAALTGTATKWTPTEVRELRRPLQTNDKGQFRVTLLVDGRPLTFEMLIDFDAGSVSYRTTRPSSGGVMPGFHPPLPLLQFLTPSFLDLFIFDGEFADELLKQGGGRADAAIGALCHLDLLNEVRRTAELEWKRRTSQGGPKSAASLAKLNDERDELIKHKAKLERAREKAQNKLGTGTGEADELRKKINEKLSSVETTKSQHAASQLALQTANADVSTASGAVMTLLRMPLALHPHFSHALVELRDNLDHLKLPENTSAQFFAELVKETECICGRTMTSAAQEEILKRAKSYLDYEESGTINALKHDISRFVVPTEQASRHEQLELALSSLGAAKRQQRKEQQTLSALAQKLIDAGDAELQAWQMALNALEVELARCTEALESINASNEEESAWPILSLKLVEKKLKQVGRKIAELTETVELKKKTDTLNGILTAAETLARASIRADLLRDSNARLEHVLADDPIRIDRIDQSLHLANQTDASAGQKLSVGYTFLMSALSRGNNDFPLIVDSPANPIDEGVRRRIGKLIPTLCTQFVGFTINTERAGFVQTLERSSDDCLLLTLFRRTEGTRRLELNLPADGVTQTETATLVKDRDYFMSFDVTDEKDL